MSVKRMRYVRKEDELCQDSTEKETRTNLHDSKTVSAQIKVIGRVHLLKKRKTLTVQTFLKKIYSK